MSYAAIAKQHIPEGEMPQPDQGLVDGHFSGETEAHQTVDSKINVLPAGSDPEHPDYHPEPVHHHETITVNPPPVAEPHVSEAAPKPLPTPHKHDISLPEPGSQYEHDKAEAEAKAKAKADKAEKEVKATADKAEKNVKEGLDTAEKNVKEGINTAEKEVKRGAAKAEKEIKNGADKAEKKAKELANKAKKEVEVIESKLGPYWEKTKDIVLRPGTLGGLMGVVNVGILSTIGYFAYTRRDQPWDQRIVAGSVLGPLALFGAEGYVADSYLSTEEGQREAERAKREGSKLYMEARERILRPQVAGGLVGAVNIAILGTVGYFAHQNWNRPWDRRTVSAIAVGLLGLSGLEGYAGKVYADKH